MKAGKINFFGCSRLSIIRTPCIAFPQTSIPRAPCGNYFGSARWSATSRGEMSSRNKAPRMFRSLAERHFLVWDLSGAILIWLKKKRLRDCVYVCAPSRLYRRDWNFLVKKKKSKKNIVSGKKNPVVAGLLRHYGVLVSSRFFSNSRCLARRYYLRRSSHQPKVPSAPPGSQTIKRFIFASPTATICIIKTWKTKNN